MHIRSKHSILVLGMIVFSAFLWGGELAGNRIGSGVQDSQLLATRYYARNRTSDFFQRSANHTMRKVSASTGSNRSVPRR